MANLDDFIIRARGNYLDINDVNDWKTVDAIFNTIRNISLFIDI